MMLPFSLPLPPCQGIKPFSMLIDHAGNVKICDFGIHGQLLNCEVITRDGGAAKIVAVSLCNN